MQPFLINPGSQQSPQPCNQTSLVSIPFRPQQDKGARSRAKSEAHFLCGQSLKESGDLKEAIEEFNKVINVVPTHTKVNSYNTVK